MNKKMTSEQIEIANQLHKNGTNWETIAVYLKTNTNDLRKWRKHYEQTQHKTK